MLLRNVAPSNIQWGRKLIGGSLATGDALNACETLYLTKFGILVALGAFIAPKEVLVRRPAPPGIRPFFRK